jgi:hypothetical protein
MSGSARRTGWGSGWDEEGPAPRRQHILETHLDFILDSESEALATRPSAGLTIAGIGLPKVYRRFTAVLNLEPWQLGANRRFPQASISP